MILLIHGEDAVSSRKILDDQKEKHKDDERQYFEGSSLDLETILTCDQSQSLFQNSKTIIIENLLSGQLSNQKEKILSYLSSEQLTSNIIIWEKGEISKSNIKKFLPYAKDILCQPPQMLFKFLDTMFDNPVSSISLFHNVTSIREAELVYSMLVRQFRYLIIARDMGAVGLSDMQRWQAEKFVRQAMQFDLNKLISFYRFLLSIDYQIKSGQTPYSMTELLDIFLLNL